MDKNFKVWLISTYFGIGVLYAIYQHFWGQYNYKPFGFNLGQGIFWPAMMFPGVGKFIGGLLILAVIGFIVLRPRN
ncbi:hypothetical protein [Acinetobacter populi]|uniref:Uncharacterized protein n=1 Tax=Acinetobacter populi TaxID=1582270 RepID=A0A1Z9YZ02_9GAMM|nr:hypothetical protein [Acinetobacter populi]OUY07433.1 hypothetical protein CAP51_06665 [Acinetobacter populi]